MKWKSIRDYEGYYEVSDAGYVRSLDRIIPDKTTHTKRLKGKMMKLTPSVGRDGDGYLVVNLRKNHTSSVRLVHRLVAEAFLPNPNDLDTVNHKDGNKRNNDVSNLEWATYSDNNIHALCTGLRSPRGNVIAQFDLEGNLVNVYMSARQASRDTGISYGMISHCLNNRANYAGGYKWIKVEKCNDYLSFESTTDDELPLEVQERVYPKI